MNATPQPPATIYPSALLQLLDRIDSHSPLKSPTALAVFRLYCLEQLTVTDVARRCRCSVGTVSNRLKLIRSISGLNPEHLACPGVPPRRPRGRPKQLKSSA